MKKKNKIACSMAVLFGSAQTYASFHHENSCLILLDGIAAFSNDVEGNNTKCYTINNEVFDVGDDMEHAYCVPNPAK